jgi:hypothetical protein
VERAGQGPLTQPTPRAGLLRAAPAVLARPWLWPTAVVQLFALAPRGWWRRSPFLPLPDREYLGFRMQTMYGDPDRPPDPADLLAYLNWCRRYR